MRNRLTFSLATIAVVLYGTACGDQALAPKAKTLPTLKSAPMPTGAPRPDVIVDRMADDSTSADFTVTPSGGAFVIGPHAIYFPDHSICDPRVSSYGPGEWDQPCVPLDEPIQIHAEVRTENGRSWVDFSPSLRFVPTDDPQKYVWIYMKAPFQADTSSDLSQYAILWAPAPDEQPVNEAAADSTLGTYVWRDGGISFRRVKHFTGYQVGAGFFSSMFADELVVSVEF
jgi:hypothetical protein